ncbi:hypothetical protein GC194_05410 [bacterium]|nr:hypothetical protein [bacterium]
MKTVLHSVIAISLLGIVASFSACSSSGCTNPLAVNYDENASKDDGSCSFENALMLKLSYLVDNEPLVLNSKTYTNAAGNSYVIERLHFYLSEIEAFYANGQVEKIADYHYFDILDNGTQQIKLTDVAKGEIDSLRFIFGLRGALNENYALPNTMVNINMQWPTPMGGGYHYMKFEGKFAANDATEHSFNVHLGRLVDDSGTTDPSFQVTLPLQSLSVNDWPVGIEVGMDLNRWFDGEQNYDFNNFGEGIMGDHKAQKLLKANGRNDVFKFIKSWEDILE